MAKRRVGRYPKAFRKMAVERLKGCDNIIALADELGVHRRLLYKWRDQLEPIDDGQVPPENGKERELRLQVAQLKRLVADKTLEADFFRGALQKVEARRRKQLVLLPISNHPFTSSAAQGNMGGHGCDSFTKCHSGSCIGAETTSTWSDYELCCLEGFDRGVYGLTQYRADSRPCQQTFARAAPDANHQCDPHQP